VGIDVASSRRTVASKDAWLYGWAAGYAAVGSASLLVPLYVIDLGADAFLVSLVAATAAFAGVPGAVIWGRLVTTTKRRRPFVLVALGSAATVLFSMPFYDSPWAVLVANAVLWFVVAAAAPVLNLIVVEGHDPKAWPTRFGLLNSYQGYGWLAGLLVGAAWTGAAGALTGLDPLAAKQLLFVATGLAAAAGFLLVYVRYPERPTVSDRRFERILARLPRNGWSTNGVARAIPFGPTRVYWALRDLRLERGYGARRRGQFPPPLVRYLAAATLFFVGFSAFFGPLPAYLTDAGYATDAVFGLFVVNSAASAVSYGRVGAFVSRSDPVRMQTGALLARVAAFPLVAFLGTTLSPPVGLLAVGLVFAAIGVSWAVIAVTATGLVTSLAPESVRGEALGAYTALGSLGGGIGSVLGGAVASAVGYLVAFAVAAVCVLGAVVVAAAGRRTTGAS
jgi:MFS family permease